MIFEIFYITTSKSNITYFKPCIQELQKNMFAFCIFAHIAKYIYLSITDAQAQADNCF